MEGALWRKQEREGENGVSAKNVFITLMKEKLSH